jgi:hypothetical protein
MLSEKTIHKVGRIDQVIRDYFTSNPTIKEIAAKDLMPEFIKKEIFVKDSSRPGLPIRNILRELDAENKLDLLAHCKVVRKKINRNWYFISRK